jgi:hypothetical protein
VGPRIRLNGKATDDYHECLVQLFGVMKHDVPGFQFQNLHCVAVDFEIAFSNALRRILGDAKADSVLQGCQVHFLRSASRIAKRVAIDDNDEKAFNCLAKKIFDRNSTTTKDEVRNIFRILTAEIPAPSTMSLTDHSTWKRSADWAEWFQRENTLSKPLVPNRARSRLNRNLFPELLCPDLFGTMTNVHLPKTTNAVENANGRCGDHAKPATVAMLDRYRYFH